MLRTSDLVFIPAVGFRSGSGRLLREPAISERGTWRLSVDHFVTGPEGTALTYSLSGPAPRITAEPAEAPSWLRDPVELRTEDGLVFEPTPGGQLGQQHWSVSPGSKHQTIRRVVTFPALSPSVTRVALVLSSAAGEWTVPITLTPIAKLGIPATRLESRDRHHGVTVVAGAIAASDSITAVELRTQLDPTTHGRFMRSLGAERTSRGGESSLVLEDDAGTRVGEFATFNDHAGDGRELQQVMVFPPLSRNARHAVLTIPETHVAEATGAPVTLPIPSEAVITLGPHRAHARITRDSTDRGSVIRVQLDDGGWHNDCRLVYPETVRLDGVTRPVGPTTTLPGEPVQSLDPTGEAQMITLDDPVVKLRGPWRLGLAL